MLSFPYLAFFFCVLVTYTMFLLKGYNGSSLSYAFALINAQLLQAHPLVIRNKWVAAYPDLLSRNVPGIDTSAQLQRSKRLGEKKVIQGISA